MTTTVAELDDAKALVERAKAGDTEAFGLIYQQHAQWIQGYVLSRVRDHHLAEDITSETFRRALNSIHAFTWQGLDVRAWLTTIARNIIFDRAKSARHLRDMPVGDFFDFELPDRSPEADPEGRTVAYFTNVALLSAVLQLHPDQQECIVLRFLRGLSIAETAQAMGRNEGVVKALQSRASAKLAVALNGSRRSGRDAPAQRRADRRFDAADFPHVNLPYRSHRPQSELVAAAGGPPEESADEFLPDDEPEPEEPPYALTARDLRILRAMAGGRSDADIVAELFLAEDELRALAGRIFDVLGARDRDCAVAIGRRTGLAS